MIMRNLAQDTIRSLIKEVFTTEDATMKDKIKDQLQCFTNFKYIRMNGYWDCVKFDEKYKEIIIPCQLNFFSEECEKMGAIPFTIEIKADRIDGVVEDMFIINLETNEIFIRDAFDNYRNEINAEMIDFLNTVLD